MIWVVGKGEVGNLITENKCKPMRREEAIFIPSFPQSLILERLPVSKSQERGICREKDYIAISDSTSSCNPHIVTRGMASTKNGVSGLVMSGGKGAGLDASLTLR